jgi:hypothetical protein
LYPSFPAIKAVYYFSKIITDGKKSFILKVDD